MGYQNGLGLGKDKQGITDPVSFSANPGKCGFGLQLKQIACTENKTDVSKLIEKSKYIVYIML